MSIAPLFSSAPRCRIRLGDQQLAAAVGYNFNISVDVQPVMVLGEVAPVALETTMYNIVTGTFQVLRLRDPEAGTIQVPKKDAQGNNITIPVAGGNQIVYDTITGAGVQAKLAGHLDVAQFLLTRTFDVHVYITVPQAIIDSSVSPAGTQAAAPTGGSGLLSETAIGHTEILWLKIQDCRITSRNTNITMGQLINEPLNFQGLLAVNKESDDISSDNKVVNSL